MAEKYIVTLFVIEAVIYMENFSLAKNPYFY